jgi:arylsulfate sulfotransferase
MSRDPAAAWPTVCAVVLLGGAVACHDAIVGSAPPPPVLSAVAVQANPLNALSVVATFDIERGDSARLAYWTDGGTVATTPYYAVAGGAGPARLVALGLLPNTGYHFAIAAIGPGGAISSDTLAYRTADLPEILQGVHLSIVGAAPRGYLVTEVSHDSGAFVLAFDPEGQIRWYQRIPIHPDESAMETKQLPNGDFTVYVGASTGWQPVGGRYIEFRPDGTIVRVYTAGAPYYTDNHELVVTMTRDGVTAAHLFGYDMRTLDLTALGGRPDQLVAGHAILRQSASGVTEFLWNAWDHFSLADWVFVPPNLGLYSSIDFDHPNSLAIDADGNYVVSFAMLGEIAKIDAVTGEMLWRFGGRHNQFSILGDPLNGFGFQHDVRVLDNGDLLFYDNGLVHNPPESRAVEYRLDQQAKTATLVWQFRHDPPLFTPFVGSVQRLRSGNTLVGYGAASSMIEVTAAGQVVWEGRLTLNGQALPFFYRVRRIGSLYRSVEP